MFSGMSNAVCDGYPSSVLLRNPPSPKGEGFRKVCVSLCQVIISLFWQRFLLIFSIQLRASHESLPPWGKGDRVAVDEG